MTADLAGWLSAQYDKAEQAVKAATPGPWEFDGEEPTDPNREGGYYIAAVEVVDPPNREWGSVLPSNVVRQGYDCPSGVLHRPDAEFIAAHDPSWRLRDIARKREILADCLEATRVSGATWLLADRTMRRLAAEFEREPGYLDEWRI